MRPRLLDLFSGAGGAAMGYHRAGFEVVGVDVKPQPNYPFEFHQADALTVLDSLLWNSQYLSHGYGVVNFGLDYEGRFDVIHASPPCQAYAATKVLRKSDSGHPDLLVPTIERIMATGLSFVVENVPGAPFPDALYRVMLCGSMFGLRVRRHRWFATNVAMLVPTCQHGASSDLVGVYGASDGLHEPGFKHPGNRRGPRQATTAEAREVMGMPWVTEHVGLTNAIPPAYTEFIGEALMAHLRATAAA